MQSENLKINIIHREKSFLVCEKPAKIPCESADKDKETVLSLLENQLSENGKKPYIAMVHRLDQVTSGLMVFALTKSAACKLSNCFSSGNSEKEYLAIVHGEPSKSGEMRDLLFRDAKKNKSFVVKKERKGVKQAILEYETLKTLDSPAGKLSMVKIKLCTGRTHQIRVQFAYRGMYLAGDGKYGAKDNFKDVALYSHRISFPNPDTDEKVEFQKEPSQIFPFTMFE